MATPDPVATAVLLGTGDAGAVKLEGWLAMGEAEKTFRLFTAADFLHWVEIAADDLVHQIPGEDRKDHGEGRSVIWVKHDARITWCRSDIAFAFEELEAGEQDDPTAIRPRPYGMIRPRPSG
jgi:hypothetical protein